MKLKALFIYSFFLSVISSYGQVNIPGSFFQSVDIANDSLTLGFHSSVKNDVQNAAEFLDPQARVSVNSNYPRGLNDGPVWKGKGVTSEFHFGIAGKFGALSYTFYPVVYQSQNLSYDLAPQQVNNISQYGYQFGSGRIDLVQQYGGSSYAALHPGQSEIKLQFGKFLTSVSTQNYSVGPSVFNPIILSRQGGGFPHLRIGSEPLDLKIKNLELGKLEANFLVGYLQESDYFDSDPDNDLSYFNGLFLAYSPPFLKNLTLGFNKALYKQTQRFAAQDLISVIKVLDTVGVNDQFDQLASATMEWRFPEVGFRAYAEFAFNDFGGAYKWIEPEHSRAYTVGFEKLTTFKNDDALNIIYEHTNLSRNHTYLWRAEPSFYVHHLNRQGYTNRGQIIGAGIGPGSNSDMLQVKYLHKNQVFGIGAQRIENNKDYFAVNIRDRRLHDIEYSIGSFYQIDLNKLTLSAELIYSKNHNTYYVFYNHQKNLYASVRVLYKLK